MVCRSTDDYEAMALAGCQVIGEPAFWAGYDRTSVSSFHDYFMQISAYEPLRAARFGIKHYCWICINAKEAENIEFAREVIQIIPDFLDKPTVLGIGEIGLNRNTPNEIAVFEEQLDMAIKYNQLVLIHTPHLEDKLKGTKITLSLLKNRPELDPSRVLIDHCEEQTVGIVKDAGYWAGLSIYPSCKLTVKRAADILECYGMDNIWLNCSTDWAESDPLAVPKVGLELRARGYSQDVVDGVLIHNPASFMAQSPHWQADLSLVPGAGSKGAMNV